MHLQLRERLEGLLSMMPNPNVGYSPAQLLDRLPAFAELSSDDLDKAKTLVHARFLVEFELDIRVRRLQCRISAFNHHLDCFLQTFQDGEGGIRLAHRDLDSSAKDLIVELAQLPAGVWLWPEKR